MAFATSAVRDATNCDGFSPRSPIRPASRSTSLGHRRARLTSLAVRRWYGWSAGRILAFDIGGGSLRMSNGVDEEPDVALSLPLGAGRLTRSGCPTTRRTAGGSLCCVVGSTPRQGRSQSLPTAVVPTSSSRHRRRSLLGPAHRSGPVERRATARRELTASRASAAHRLHLTDGRVRSCRTRRRQQRPAGQIVAGALVAEAAMRALEVDTLKICPWALREGVILRRLDSGLQ